MCVDCQRVVCVLLHDIVCVLCRVSESRMCFCVCRVSESRMCRCVWGVKKACVFYCLMSYVYFVGCQKGVCRVSDSHRCV